MHHPTPLPAVGAAFAFRSALSAEFVSVWFATSSPPGPPVVLAIASRQERRPRRKFDLFAEVLHAGVPLGPSPLLCRRGGDSRLRKYYLEIEVTSQRGAAAGGDGGAVGSARLRARAVRERCSSAGAVRFGMCWTRNHWWRRLVADTVCRLKKLWNRHGGEIRPLPHAFLQVILRHTR